MERVIFWRWKPLGLVCFWLFCGCFTGSCRSASKIPMVSYSSVPPVQPTSFAIADEIGLDDDVGEEEEFWEPMHLNMKGADGVGGALHLKGVFDWPVDEARLTRGYFLKHPRRKRGRPHLGIDLANRKGTPIFASHDGWVIYAGTGFRGYGRMIMLEGPRGDYATVYAHLSRVRVRQGFWVKQGDWIADMGNTGRSTGTHLHFEIRTLAGAVDPLLFLPPVREQRSGYHFGVGRNWLIKPDQSIPNASSVDRAPSTHPSLEENSMTVSDENREEL